MDLLHDGRGTIVAVLDTGVDMGAAGLQTTSDGRRKLIDVIDATVLDIHGGQLIWRHDVQMTRKCKAKDARVKFGAEEWTLNPTWKAVDDVFRGGWKRGYELFPDLLVKRLAKENKQNFLKKQREIELQLRRQLVLATGEERKEIQARLNHLEYVHSSFEDPGPLYRCILFHDGTQWLAAISETLDFTSVRAMGVFRHHNEFGTFSTASMLNYAFNVYDDGDVLSIVCDAGSHGTHVAAILAAFDAEKPENNGIAPGAQLVSIKIADTRMGSAETGTAISRAMLAVVEHQCDVVNISYGEHAIHPNYGRAVDLLQQVVNKHGITVVGSVGNDGPALGTIKAPGGLSSCIIGVGAFVTPAMMEAEYSMFPGHSSMAYTWSSRGPSLDGDMGISVCAPGGAITSVPNWTLMRKQLKNGTSMAAPYCAGVVAQLISTLKAQSVFYHPYSIRRALENTAIKVPSVDPFASGNGLIQALPAFNYLVKESNRVKDSEPWYYEIRCGTSNSTLNQRGICLRQSFETSGLVDRLVQVTPVFTTDAPNTARLSFEMVFDLISTQPWLSIPKSLVLCNESRSFRVAIDMDCIAPNRAYFAEILGYNKHSGPLFRVPVCIFKPLRVQDSFSIDAAIVPGDIHRSFISVPDGSTWMNITISQPPSAKAYTIVLQMNQYEPQRRPNSRYFTKRFTLETEVTHSMSVLANSTLEIAIAPLWNTPGGPFHVHIAANFRGILPDSNQIALHGGSGSVRVNLTSVLRSEILQPEAKLTIWSQRLRPNTSKVEPCSARSMHSDHRLMYQLILTYKFDQTSKGSITPRLPLLNDQLYDSPFESQLIMIFNTNKMLIGTSSAYPREIQVPKGSYVARVQICHQDYSVLDGLIHMILCIERSIKELAMPVYSRADAAALNLKSMASMELHRGSVVPVFVGEPSFSKVPKEASTGDVLLGRITFGKKQANQGQCSGCKPGGFELSYTIPLPETKYKEPEVKSVNVSTTSDDVKEMEANAMRDFIVSRLTKSIGKDCFQTIYQQLRPSYPDYLPILQTQLHHFDHEKKRMHQLDDIVHAANTILNLLAPQIPDLITPPGLQVASKESRKEKDKTKAIYIDALARKARALADQNHSEFDTVCQTLQQWVNPNDFKYIYCSFHHDQQKEHYGLALERLQKFDPSEHSKIMGSAKAIELKLKLYLKLGWTQLVEYQQQWAAIENPLDFTRESDQMNSKDAVGAYLSSLRGERKHVDKIDEGIPFFVPQLSKVKTSAMCSKKQTHLLFGYETLKHGYEESYRKQGNPLFYTEEKMHERQQLQNDRQVQACLGRFWETFSSIRLGKTSIDEPEYCDVFVKLFKALVPPQEFAVAEARKIVEKDWARDVGATSETMSKAMFYRSLFEVADIWTTDIGIDEYVTFLTKLFDRVTMTVFDQEKALWLTKFADLDVIKSSWEENQSGESISPKRQAELRLKKKSMTLGAIPISEEKRDLPNLVLSPTRSFRQRKSERKLLIDTPAIDPPEMTESSSKEAVEAPKQSPTRNSSPRKTKVYHDSATGSSLEQVRVAMPSIYLSPDLEVQKEDASAIKRRQRESAKLANRLRRTTY